MTPQSTQDEDMSDQQPTESWTWSLVACVDCAKPLKVRGTPPAQPLCLHCDIIRAAPADIRERIRNTLAPLPEQEPAESVARI
jgi:hypothetical protein